MAAKIGILGESTAVTVAAVTVYTVPADKAARVRILFYYYTGSGVTVGHAVSIGMPGIQGNLVQQISGDKQLWTGILTASNAADMAKIGVHDATFASGQLERANNNRTTIITPFPVDYFLSTGDTVVAQIGGSSPGDYIFQVIGVEDDA